MTKLTRMAATAGTLSFGFLAAYLYIQYPLKEVELAAPELPPLFGVGGLLQSSELDEGASSGGYVVHETTRTLSEQIVFNLTGGSYLFILMAYVLMSSIFALVFSAVQRYCIGRMLPAETKELISGGLTFLARKIIVLSGLPDQIHGEVFLWFLAWSTFYGWMGALTHLATMKLERLMSSPTLTSWKHVSIVLTLAVIFIFNVVFSVLLFVDGSMSLHVALLCVFDAACIAITALRTLALFALHVMDLHGTGGLFASPSPGAYVSRTYYTKLVGETSLLMAYLAHYSHVIYNHGFAMTFIDLLLIFQIRLVASNLYKAFRVHRDYLSVSHSLDSIPAATSEEIAAYNDSCAICRDDLVEAVKLSCSHIFHKECLKGWTQQQGTCPICRTPLPGYRAPRAPPQQQPHQQHQHQRQHPQQHQQQPFMPPDGIQPLHPMEDVGQHARMHTHMHMHAHAPPRFPPQVPGTAGPVRREWRFNTAGWLGLPQFSFQYVQRNNAGAHHHHQQQQQQQQQQQHWQGFTAEEGQFLGRLPVHLAGMAQQVREVLPHAPLDAILQSLVSTHSTEATIEHLLTMPFPETGATSTAPPEAASAGEADSSAFAPPEPAAAAASAAAAAAVPEVASEAQSAPPPQGASGSSSLRERTRQAAERRRQRSMSIEE